MTIDELKSQNKARRQHNMETKFEVRDHPHSNKHLLLVVTTARGYVYACPSAWEPGDSPKPSTESVRYTWKHYRHYFLPYNESTGNYCV